MGGTILVVLTGAAGGLAGLLNYYQYANIDPLGLLLTPVVIVAVGAPFGIAAAFTRELTTDAVDEAERAAPRFTFDWPRLLLPMLTGGFGAVGTLSLLISIRGQGEFRWLSPILFGFLLPSLTTIAVLALRSDA